MTKKSFISVIFNICPYIFFLVSLNTRCLNVTRKPATQVHAYTYPSSWINAGLSMSWLLRTALAWRLPFPYYWDELCPLLRAYWKKLPILHILANGKSISSHLEKCPQAVGQNLKQTFFSFFQIKKAYNFEL